MLDSVHVKNLALVKEADIFFGEGLNILTGETGAGKSILIDAIGMGLGGRVQKSFLREDAGDGLIELSFTEPNGPSLELLTQMEISPAEEDALLIARRISGTRSLIRINDETFTAGKLKELAPHLIDIYGQNEHQTLLDRASQLALVDLYEDALIRPLKEAVKQAFHRVKKAEEALLALSFGEEERLRRLDLLTYEVQEVEAASPAAGEDEKLEAEYRLLRNARKITETLGNAYEETGYDAGGAGDAIGRAAKAMEAVTGLDPAIDDMYSAILEIDALMNDFNRSVAGYLSDFSMDEGRLMEVETRLDLLNRLKAKYGGSIESVLRICEQNQKAIEELESHAQRREEAQKALEEAQKELSVSAKNLSKARRRSAQRFEDEAAKALLELNFAQAIFKVQLEEKEIPGENGVDMVEFLLSTNPGEEVRPLRLVASGGELSRIMLGIKAMFAAKGDAGTLIFDEIDTGISGRTAQKVAEKLHRVSRGRQVICITHLPQIAAMADHHFLIEKVVEGEHTETKIRELNEADSIAELARMLGGAEITEQTMRSAAEMKHLARTASF